MSRRHERMKRALRIIALATGIGGAVSVAAEPFDTAALTSVLERAGERVEHYFTRAQSIVCLEVVRLLPLSASWGSEGPGRTVESELRLSWAPEPEGAVVDRSANPAAGAACQRPQAARKGLEQLH